MANPPVTAQRGQGGLTAGAAASMDAWYPDDGAPSVIRKSSDEREQHRRSLWAYYDRRVAGRLPGLANAHAYWTGLGVTVEVEDIAAEAAQLERLVRELSAVRFVEVGAGPGTFTRHLREWHRHRPESKGARHSAHQSSGGTCDPGRCHGPTRRVPRRRPLLLRPPLWLASSRGA